MNKNALDSLIPVLSGQQFRERSLVCNGAKTRVESIGKRGFNKVLGTLLNLWYFSY